MFSQRFSFSVRLSLDSHCLFLWSYSRRNRISWLNSLKNHFLPDENRNTNIYVISRRLIFVFSFSISPTRSVSKWMVYQIDEEMIHVKPLRTEIRNSTRRSRDVWMFGVRRYPYKTFIDTFEWANGIWAKSINNNKLATKSLIFHNRPMEKEKNQLSRARESIMRSDMEIRARQSKMWNNKMQITGLLSTLWKVYLRAPQRARLQAASASANWFCRAAPPTPAARASSSRSRGRPTRLEILFKHSTFTIAKWRANAARSNIDEKWNSRPSHTHIIIRLTFYNSYRDCKQTDGQKPRANELRYFHWNDTKLFSDPSPLALVCF